MSNNSYKRMMDKAVPSAALIQKTKSKMLKEDTVLSIETRSIRRPLPAVIVIVVILSLLTAGFVFANGSQIIQLLGGGRIESGKTSDGEDYISISQYETNPAEVRDGRVYFVLDGSDRDITSHCTESTYFEYERIAENGYRHVLVVGGEPDNLGWGEFIWDEDGNLVGSTAQFHKDIYGEQPEWLRLAEGTLRN